MHLFVIDRKPIFWALDIYYSTELVFQAARLGILILVYVIIAVITEADLTLFYKVGMCIPAEGRAFGH